VRGTGWVFVLGKLDAGKRGRMETGQMGTWGGEGEEGERKGIGADADGSPMDATPGDRREGKLERWMGWCHGRVCCVCEGLVGG
jgi:hypothetical protein